MKFQIPSPPDTRPNVMHAVPITKLLSPETLYLFEIVYQGINMKNT